MSVTKVTAWLGLAAMVGSAVLFAVDRFESQASAQETHERLAADDERGRLESELELCKLKIDFLIRILESRPHTQSEAADFQYQQARRLQLESRLREVARKG